MWFFDRFDFVAEDAQTREPVAIGYEKGVPMGGDLQQALKSKSPTLLVGALKDSISGNLDRIQVMKGWLDKDGKTEERIYNVAVSDDRKIIAECCCPTPVSNTVNAGKATWKNTIGDPELITVWRDPECDPALNAFCYARVIEIHTPLGNPKHELFAQRVAKGESATAAYRAIYGAGKNADVDGPRLMGNDWVCARVAALQASAAKACGLTLERKRELLAGFANNCDAKMADRIAAVTADVKLAGELTEKAEIKDTPPGTDRGAADTVGGSAQAACAGVSAGVSAGSALGGGEIQAPPGTGSRQVAAKCQASAPANSPRAQ